MKKNLMLTCLFTGIISLLLLCLQRYDHTLSVKEAQFNKEGKIKFTHVFIGSSDVATSILPSKFDSEMFNRGCHSRSFNFSVVNITPIVLYRILKFLKNSKNIDSNTVVYIGQIRKQSKPLMPFVELREYMNFDLDYFLFSIKSASSIDLKIKFFYENVLLFVKKLFLTKSNIFAIQPKHERDSFAKLLKYEKSLTNGEIPYTKIFNSTWKVNEESFNKGLKDFNDAWNDSITYSHKNNMFYEKLKDEFSSLTIKNFIGVTYFMNEIVESGYGSAFTIHPKNFSTIFEPQYWQDNYHLNQKGAEIFSGKIASILCDQK